MKKHAQERTPMVFDKEIGVARRKPDAIDQDNGRMTPKHNGDLQDCHSHHRPRVPGLEGRMVSREGPKAPMGPQGSLLRAASSFCSM